MVFALAVAVFFFSFRLRADGPDPSIKIDLVAAAFIGVAIVLLTLGFNNLNAWGIFTVPLYIQIVQGRTPFDIALAMMPFNLTMFVTATLVFNVLVTAAPKSLAGDVGSLRGNTQNLASAVGTAVAGALLVTVLSIGIGRPLPSIQSCRRNWLYRWIWIR